MVCFLEFPKNSQGFIFYEWYWLIVYQFLWVFFNSLKLHSKKFLKIVAPWNFRRFFLLEKPPFLGAKKRLWCSEVTKQLMQLELGPRGINTDGLKRLSQLSIDNQMLDVSTWPCFFFLGGGEAGRGLVCRKHFNYCLVYIFSSFLFDLTKSTGICGPFTRYHRLHVLARFRDSLPVVYYLVVCLCLCVCHLQHLGRWSPEFWDQSLYVSWLRFGYPIPRGSVSSPSTNAPSWIQWKIPPLGCLASSRRRQDGKTCLGFTWSGYAATIPLWVRLIMHESLNVFDIDIYIHTYCGWHE